MSQSLTSRKLQSTIGERQMYFRGTFNQHQQIQFLYFIWYFSWNSRLKILLNLRNNRNQTLSELSVLTFLCIYALFVSISPSVSLGLLTGSSFSLTHSVSLQFVLLLYIMGHQTISVKAKSAIFDALWTIKSLLQLLKSAVA